MGVHKMLKNKTKYKVTGISGKEYTFGVYNYPGKWKAVAGVYLITHREVRQGVGSHSRIYVGETGKLNERHSSHHKANCFRRKKANCLCFLPEKSEKRRLEIEKDILLGGNWPCNSK